MGNFKLPRLLIAAVIFFVVVTILSLDSVNILNGYFMVIINRCLIFVILASSLNLINGITRPLWVSSSASPPCGSKATTSPL